MFYEESENIELKKSISRLPDALKSICAFLNHKGGSVFFGVTSGGEIKGMDVSDKVLMKISQQITRIRPEITPEIRENAELFNCTDRTARTDLKGMFELGIVKKRKEGYQIHYSLSDTFRKFPEISGNY